jgi:hypothetical protein
MSCKNTTKKIKTINQQCGISQADIEKSKSRMRFYMGLMNEVLRDQDFSHLRGQKFACIENLLLSLGRFFDFEQKRISAYNPFKISLKIAIESNTAYCEGFCLPWDGGIPEPHAWVCDLEKNIIITAREGLHFGIALNPSFVKERFRETGDNGIFDFDNKSKNPILDFGFPKDSLFKW